MSMFKTAFASLVVTSQGGKVVPAPVSTPRAPAWVNPNTGKTVGVQKAC